MLVQAESKGGFLHRLFKLESKKNKRKISKEECESTKKKSERKICREEGSFTAHPNTGGQASS
jgi:hypothetical protein